MIGIAGLSLFYYLFLFSVTKDFQHPFNQFGLFQPWMSFLILGFGIQMGLLLLIKNGFHISIQKQKDAKLATGASTAVSGMAMIACCAHHSIEVLPILGLSAATVFLSEYQEQLLIFGVFVNMAGIAMMFWFIFGKAKPKLIINFLTVKIKNML